MSEAILNPTLTSDATDGLHADALRAEKWAGEPFLHPGEEPAEALAPGTARRAAFDEALAEIESGRKAPSSRWKVRFGFLLGLERVLSMKPPATAAGTELRKHQIDALAGMLTELIAANQRHARRTRTGTATATPSSSRRKPRRRTRQSTRRSTTKARTSRRDSSAKIRAQSAAIASAIRRRRGRRSPPRASSKQRARSGS